MAGSDLVELGGNVFRAAMVLPRSARVLPEAFSLTLMLDMPGLGVMLVGVSKNPL